MHFLAISGSLRTASTNTALLRALAHAAKQPLHVTVYDGLGCLPHFSPDQEGDRTPQPVLDFADAIAKSDGLFISCPEYIHALPGTFKNALDWLVARQEIIGKPIALLHASHRGDDVLADLRRVLGTVSTRFSEHIFLRVALNKLTPEAVSELLAHPDHMLMLRGFLDQFADFVQSGIQS